MAINQKIAELRKANNLTQEQLASKIYVTRQAVSRWEIGETTPSIDMIKLLAVTFDVPITELFELPPEGNFCHSCGMHLDNNEDRAKNADGSPSNEWCKWCVEDNSFTSNESMEEMIERCAPMMVESGSFASIDEAVSLLGAILPQLKRWSA